MCTLSWLLTPGETHLVFSRDESDRRAIAEPPALREHHGVTLLAPRDPDGGGTWIAVGQRGLVVCLLNDYSRARVWQEPPDGRLSRGELVVDYAVMSNPQEVWQHIEARDLSRFPPFQMIVFEIGREPISHHYDGKALRHRMVPICPVVSSSAHFPKVERLRQQVFRERIASKKSATYKDLLAYHRWNTPPESAVAMRRSERGTKSITHIHLLNNKAELRYFPGHPDVADKDNPFVSQLELTSRRPTEHDEPIQAGKETYALKRLFEEGNPKLARWMPDIAYRILGKLVGTDMANRYFYELGPTSPRNFAEAVLRSRDMAVTVEPQAEAPKTDSAPIYFANHPMGGLDGLAFLAWLIRRHGSAVAPVNEVLRQIPQSRPYFIGLARGGSRREIAAQMKETFERKLPTMIFPSGAAARKRGGELVEEPWGRSFVRMALKYERPLVPVYIHGHNSEYFYRLARWRKRCGIPINLEMLLLAHETNLPSLHHLLITEGTTIRPKELFDLGENDFARMKVLRESVEDMGRDARSRQVWSE